MAHTTPSPPFNATANVAEASRQSAVASASGTGAVLQANVANAEITYFRACRNAAIANNISPSIFNNALKSLGVMT